MNNIKTTEDAFQRIISEHRNTLVNALVRMLPLAEAEEVCQEASMKVWLQISELDVDAIKPFWFRVARNLALSRLRHEKVRRDYSPHIQFLDSEIRAVPTTQALSEYHQSLGVLAEAINSLPPACRNVFVFRKIDGYTQKEIALKMGISVNTVENHIANGMRLCRLYVLEHMSETELPSVLSNANI